MATGCGPGRFVAELSLLFTYRVEFRVGGRSTDLVCCVPTYPVPIASCVLPMSLDRVRKVEETKPKHFDL